MSELAAQEAAWKQLLDRMVAARQLAAADAATLLRQNPGAEGMNCGAYSMPLWAAAIPI